MDFETLQSTPRYRLYARMHGNEPEIQVRRDFRAFGEVYQGFYIWLNARWLEYGQSKGETLQEARKRHGDMPDLEFDAWLARKAMGEFNGISYRFEEKPKTKHL